MSTRRIALERKLLRDPFDARSRREYAELLLEDSAFREALEQWRLIGQQDPISAEPQVGIALCLARLGDRHGARAALREAKSCGDSVEFQATIDALETELDAAVDHPGDAADTHVRATASPSRPMSREAVGFDDVAGMDPLKREIRRRIIDPFLNPGLFRRFQKKAGGGVMLYGPPGCGKTMIARAIATECGSVFRAVGSTDVISAYAGQSERNLAALFADARASAPAVLFFDELDALAYSRSKSDSQLLRGVVNEFLEQLDGLTADNRGVLVVGATNMPWDVDGALKRPGRFDRQVFVPPPDAAARARMIEMKLEGVPVGLIDAFALAARTDGFTGADIDAVIDVAKDLALDEIMERGTERSVTQSDLERAVSMVEPSSLEWLATARNLVLFGGTSGRYRELESYLRSRPR